MMMVVLVDRCGAPGGRYYIVMLYHIIQGGVFNCSAQISVLKRKTFFSTNGGHREFHGTESLIGCPTYFILVLKIGRNSSKKHPVLSIHMKKLYHKAFFISGSDI